LSPGERAKVKDPYSASVANVTDVVRAIELAAPTFGEQLVDAIIAHDPGGLKAAFAAPPTTEEQVFDPTAYLNHNGAVDVPAPKEQAGETVRGRGTFGMLAWMVMLGEHVAPDVTFRAADGWGADAYLSYEFQKNDCMRIAWVGDSTNDANEMSQAAAAWVTAMPPGDAQYTNDNNVITVSTCDPGTGQPLTTGRSKQAFSYFNLRSTAMMYELAKNLTVKKSWCIAQEVAAGATEPEAANTSVLTSPAYVPKLRQYNIDCS